MTDDIPIITMTSPLRIAVRLDRRLPAASIARSPAMSDNAALIACADAAMAPDPASVGLLPCEHAPLLATRFDVVRVEPQDGACWDALTTLAAANGLPPPKLIPAASLLAVTAVDGVLLPRLVAIDPASAEPAEAVCWIRDAGDGPSITLRPDGSARHITFTRPYDSFEAASDARLQGHHHVTPETLAGFPRPLRMVVDERCARDLWVTDRQQTAMFACLMSLVFLGFSVLVGAGIMPMDFAARHDGIDRNILTILGTLLLTVMAAIPVLIIGAVVSIACRVTGIWTRSIRFRTTTLPGILPDRVRAVLRDAAKHPIEDLDRSFSLVVEASWTRVDAPAASGACPGVDPLLVARLPSGAIALMDRFDCTRVEDHIAREHAVRP